MKLLDNLILLFNQYQFDFVITAKLLGVLTAVFVFFYRVHSNNQTRVAKSINEAVIKINDLCIDSFYKDDKQLRLKVLMLLSFLEVQLNNFPYAGTVSKFLNKNTRLFYLEADLLFRNYEESITYNTPIENKGISLTEDAKEAKIDEITAASLALIKMIDEQLKIVV